MSTPARVALLDPLVDQNPVTVQILGLCSALAVTKSVSTALVMGAAVVTVLALSNLVISTVRSLIPQSTRLIIQITVVASLVIVTDQFIRAFAYETSKELSVFVSLIVTNCIILGRTESFAMNNPPRLSFLDGVGNGLGYAGVLLAIGAVRELLGSGSLLGYPVLLTMDKAGWYTPMRLMLLSPSAFFLIAGLMWWIRSWRSEQVEAGEEAAVPATAGRP